MLLDLKEGTELNDRIFHLHLRANRSLQLFNGVDLVTAGERGQTRVLLPLHRCIELNRKKVGRFKNKSSHVLFHVLPILHGGRLGHLVISARPLRNLL